MNPNSIFSDHVANKFRSLLSNSDQSLLLNGIPVKIHYTDFNRAPQGGIILLLSNSWTISKKKFHIRNFCSPNQVLTVEHFYTQCSVHSLNKEKNQIHTPIITEKKEILWVQLIMSMTTTSEDTERKETI